MLNINELSDLSLEPFGHDDYKIAIKNFVLFYENEDDEICLAVSKKHIGVSFDFISKNNLDYKIIFLDEKSYDSLFNKFIEFKADAQMSDITNSQENATFEEEDYENELENFLQTSSDIMTSEESAPIIRFVNSLFYNGIKKNASDIHIEMHEDNGVVRYRINGILIKHIELDKNIISLVISRIKVISNLDISEKRIPQDGRTQVTIMKKTLDIRVSILPTFYGERVVMRILMQSEDIPSLQKLGMPINVREQLAKLVESSHGLILITGPTGSGKSTTLHSVLKNIESPKTNIITIEDPVEYKSNDINQIQVNNKVGLTFAHGLRSILRQDPDVILVGEIRDEETATITVQAALTGHLVLSTLHTNRAHLSINRLMDIGVDKFLIFSSLLGVVAQRLVRVLCEECKIEDDISADVLSSYSIKRVDKIYKEAGCSNCNHTGYTKRVAIAEIILINDSLKKLLSKDKVDDSEIYDNAIKSGMIPITKQLKDMVENGDTSLDELIRIGLK